MPPISLDNDVSGIVWGLLYRPKATIQTPMGPDVGDGREIYTTTLIGQNAEAPPLSTLLTIVGMAPPLSRFA